MRILSVQIQRTHSVIPTQKLTSHRLPLYFGVTQSRIPKNEKIHTFKLWAGILVLTTVLAALAVGLTFTFPPIVAPVLILYSFMGGYMLMHKIGWFR